MNIKLSLKPLYKKFLNKLSREIPLKLNYNCKYNEKQILGPIIYACIENTSLESLKNELKNKPDSDTIFYHLNKMNWHDLISIFQSMIRKNYFELRRMYRITGKVNVAIDFHDIPYYGKDNSKWILRSKHRNGTNKFFRIISIAILKRGRRFTLAVLPVNTFKSKRRLVEDIVREIKSIVDIGFILLDRGFESIEVYRLLNRMKKRWITPVRKNAKIMKIMDECAKNGIWNTVYRLQCNREYVDIKLVIYQTKDGDLVGFFTNTSAEPDFVANTYTQRWGIETGYRIKKQFRARTCSTNFTVRLFLFLVSALIYNFWVSLNVENYILYKETLTVRDVKIMFRIVIQEDFT